ncbi:MAG: alkaline phosphatase PafA [Nonlabens sp.]
MYRILTLLIGLILVGCSSKSSSTLSRKRNTQNSTITAVSPVNSLTDRPKLVVGIVVDQMRYDYLSRFYDRYGDGGFKRLMNDGFDARNNHYNFVPTYTAPGHASIYTGTSPMNHGIIGNNWYDKVRDRSIYNATDIEVDPVGTTSMDGKMSPRNMLTTTVTDELELHTQGRSKVIGISLKDRGAILPAGHVADAAYWFKGDDEGAFISSTFYMDQLPTWVQDFNTEKSIDHYLKDWNTLYPISSYVESGTDLNEFERGPKGQRKAQFPYKLKTLAPDNGNYSLLKATPYGNSIVADFAIQALKQEQMGQGDTTDFLAISFSSTDYVGHQYGVNSIEVEDTYLRLDLEIERILKELDDTVGAGNYTVFLTADHGAVDNPAYLKSKRINSGYFNSKKFRKELDKALEAEYAIDGIIRNISNGQIFFDRAVLKDNKLKSSQIQSLIVETIVDYKYIDKVFKRDDIVAGTLNNGTGRLVTNGFHHKRSGDVVYILEPAVISYGKTGSTHGSAQSYDTHVPLLFYGKGIHPGFTYERTEIIDIAPTISSLLHISFPNGTTGNPIYRALK